MSKIIGSVWTTAEALMKNPQFVVLDNSSQTHFVSAILREKKAKAVIPEKPLIVPEMEDCILRLLVIDAVNYQYWYGSPYVRPNGSCASKVVKIADKVFEKFSGDWAIDAFRDELVIERFPNVASRIDNLNEIMKGGVDFSHYIAHQIREKKQSLDELEMLLRRFPKSYADDIFLKRAFLFFIDLNRRYGWYQNCIAEFPIPADYHIPKVLNALGLLLYNNTLMEKIEGYELIPAGSLMECEIRAGALLVCRNLAKASGMTMAEVDDILFSMRKEYTNPFHLTVTTWY